MTQPLLIPLTPSMQAKSKTRNDRLKGVRNEWHCRRFMPYLLPFCNSLLSTARGFRISS
jgi:hypothetical protein